MAVRKRRIFTTISKNASSRAVSPHLHSYRNLGTDMYHAARRWQLHVWQLSGPSETWDAQLQKDLASEPVFAAIGPDLFGDLPNGEPQIDVRSTLRLRGSSRVEREGRVITVRAVLPRVVRSSPAISLPAIVPSIDSELS